MKRKVSFLAVGCGAVLVLAGPFLFRIFAEAGEYDRGKNLYENKCQLCHGVNGKGDGPASAAFRPKPANFTDPDFWKGDVVKKITDSISKGKGAMPAFTLKPEEIKDIIDYLSHTFKKP
jgi:mono/diheme cytochrome c family protein